MDFGVGSYVTYLIISLALTVWVGRTLYKNGAHFLFDVFRGNDELAKAVNHLLVVGFYLVNFGYVALALRVDSPPETLIESFESVAVKVGGVLIVLGVLHLVNVYVLNRFRTQSMVKARATAPVTPDAYVAPPTFGA